MADRVRRALTTAALVALLGVAGLGTGGAKATEFPGQGTVHGTVSDADGPVGNALVVLLGENNNSRHLRTAADGTYTVDLWPDTYRVGVQPPTGSSDGFASQGGIVVTGATDTQVDVVLPPTQTMVHVSGVARYPDGGPDAGVEVAVLPLDYEPHTFTPLRTAEDGSWDAGEIPAGTYSIEYSVLKWNGTQPTITNVGREELMIESGATISTTLNGPKPDATIYVDVVSPEGFPSDAEVSFVSAGGGEPVSGRRTDARGRSRLSASTGSYVISAGDDHVAGSASAAVSVTDGQISEILLQLRRHPFQVPHGTSSGRSGTELAWLNAQRAQWGLPAGLREAPEWSQACAAHDAYEALNAGDLTHYEQTDRPGYSEGGAWAGEHSILAGDSPAWGPESNPWNDAPIHLNQLMTPDLQVVGIDDSHGKQCVTTWPGMTRVPPPRGTVDTYPGDGTVGIPPAEFASEAPTVPGEEVGIKGLAGRELFVYEEGTGITYCGDSLDIESASLRSPGGPVEVRWVDQTSRIGGYLTGGIVIPVKPLDAHTSYTATVTLAPLEEDLCGGGPSIPEQTHTWSFTTGESNPDGFWPRPPSKHRRSTHHRHRRRHPTLRLRKRGDHMVAIGNYFKPHKRVTLRRRPGNALIERVRPDSTGHFQVSLRWGHLPTLTVIAKQGGRTIKVRMKATGGRGGA